jgi:hypothetical protein
MKQNLIRNVLMVVLLLTGASAAWADIEALQREDNGKVRYQVGNGGAGFDIHINYNNQWLQTTYRSYGYHTVLSFDGGLTRTGIGFNDNDYWGGGNFQFGKTYTVNGIEVTIVASIPDENTGAVTIKYFVTNTSEETKTFKLGTYADTQVGDNDHCKVYKEGAQTVVMENENSSSPQYGSIYKLMAVTPFSTMWFGNWNKAILPTKTFLDSFEYASGADSAIAWSWDITLQPGESVVKIIGTGETVEIFGHTDEIDVDVPENLGPDGTPTDLYEFLQFYLKQSPNPYYIKLRLHPNANYVITQPIEVMTAINIEGMDEKYPATIDASALSGPFVQISGGKASVITNIKNYYITIYGVTFKNFFLKGLKHQLFYANQKNYCIPYFTVDNCTIRMEGASQKSFIDFGGGGYLERLTIRNSTLSADDATSWSEGGLFSCVNGASYSASGAQVQNLVLTNSTLYNVGKGKTISALVENSQKFQAFTVTNNMIVNSGKKGEFIVGLNGGMNNATPKWEVYNNSFLWTDDNALYADICSEENAKASDVKITGSVECEEIIGQDANGNYIKGYVVNDLYSNGQEGVLLGNYSMNDVPQKSAKIGDPRWLQPSKLEKYITYESLDSDKDLAKEINKCAQEGYTVFTLEDNGRYAVKQPIVIDRSLLIKGKNVQIDAWENDGDAFILLSKTPGVQQNNNYYRLTEITLKGLTIKHVKNSLVYDNGIQYCVPTMTIDDCNIELTTEKVQNEAIISFKQGGVKDFTIKNSTVYGNNDVAKYFIRYNNNARLDRYGYDKDKDFQTMTYTDNTFYGLLTTDGQWGNYNGISGQAYSKFDVERNIWYNCGKDVIRRMAGGRFNGSNPMTFDKNTYFNEGVSTAESEASYDKGAILTSDPGFQNPFEGNFTLSAYSDQYAENTGDPRWYINGGHYSRTGINTISTDDVSEKIVYDLQGRRVTNTSKKGVYIVNGRKVVIK